MAMCVIKKFSIGGIPLIMEKSKKLATNENPDKLFNFSVTDCSLTKEMLKPNEFTFTLRRDTITRNDDAKHFAIVNYLIGKTVKCVVDTMLDGQVTSTLNFEGTIGSVSMKGLNVTCVANSADADLQGPPKCRCFTDMSLYSIVKTIVPTNIKVQIHSCFNDLVFPYIVQYNESDYDFLVRLAKRFGAFFYYCYDTQAMMGYMVFGKLPSSKTIEIKKPNAASVSYELQTSDPNFRLASHHYEKGADLESDGASFDYFNPEKLFKMSVKGSAEPDSDYSYFIDNPNSLPKDPAIALMDDYNMVMLCSNAGTLATCSFVSYLFDLEVGNIVKINDNGLMVVTSVNLTWDCDGSPENEVTAMMLPNDNVDLESIFAPYMDLDAYPKSSAQRAVVINNFDPMKMGRVQVQFVWQNNASDDEKKSFPWIRIAQPYGGNQKGCYVLPEIGEEVMVGFEHDNMEKPFVIGTLYHDSAEDDQKQMPESTWCEVSEGEKANEENEVKAFRTKKGHTIEFHDTKDGDGFIRIYGNNKKDKENYDIILSTDPIKTGEKKDKAFQVKSADEASEAGKDIKDKEDYKAEKLRIMVRSNGGDIMLDAGEGDIIMNAKNIRVHATGNATTLVEGKNILKVNDAQLADVGSNSLVVQKDQAIDVKGKDTEKYAKEVSVDASDAMKLKAKSLASQTDQKTEIKASDLDVNANGSVKMKANSSMDLDGGGSGKLQASSVSVEAKASAALKGATVSVEGNASLNLKTAQGSRSGLWNDQ